MGRCENIRAVAIQAAVVWLLAVKPSAAGDLEPVAHRRPGDINLFLQFDTHSLRASLTDRSLQPLPNWFRLEAEGARVQAEDWLRDAGFSLLEDRDTEGRRSYQVISNGNTDDTPTVHIRARIGLPQLSAGLQPRRNIPAIGAMIPWKRYTFELEGIDDSWRGWEVMGRLRWSAPDGHAQYGIALPLALRGGPSVGVLFQVGVRWGP